MFAMCALVLFSVRYLCAAGLKKIFKPTGYGVILTYVCWTTDVFQ